MFGLVLGFFFVGFGGFFPFEENPLVLMLPKAVAQCLQNTETILMVDRKSVLMNHVLLD